jgi:hypothetical protein
MQKLAIVAEILREISTDIRIMSGYGMAAYAVQSGHLPWLLPTKNSQFTYRDCSAF